MDIFDEIEQQRAQQPQAQQPQAPTATAVADAPAPEQHGTGDIFDRIDLDRRFQNAINTGDDAQSHQLFQQMQQVGFVPKEKGPETNLISELTPQFEDTRRHEAIAWIMQHAPRNQMPPNAPADQWNQIFTREASTPMPPELMGTDPTEIKYWQQKANDRLFHTPPPGTYLNPGEEIARFFQRAAFSQGPVAAGLERFLVNQFGTPGGTWDEQTKRFETAMAQHEQDIQPSSDKAILGPASTITGDLAAMMATAGLSRAAAAPKIAGAVERVAFGAVGGAQAAGQTTEQTYQELLQLGVPDVEARKSANLAGGVAGVVGAATSQLFAGNPADQIASHVPQETVGQAVTAGSTAAGISSTSGRFVHSQVTGKPAEYSGVLGDVLAGGAVAGGLRFVFNQFSNAKTAAERQDAADRGASAYVKNGGPGMTEADARVWLDLPAKGKVDPGDIKNAWKAKVQQTHPDAGGTAEDFQRTMAARATLLGEVGPAAPTPKKAQEPTSPAAPEAGQEKTTIRPTETPPAPEAEPGAAKAPAEGPLAGGTTETPKVDEATAQRMADEILSRASQAEETQALDTPVKPEPAPEPDLSNASFEAPGEPDAVTLQRISEGEPAKTPESGARKALKVLPHEEQPFKTREEAIAVAKNRAAILESRVYVVPQSDGTFALDQRHPGESSAVAVLPSGALESGKMSTPEPLQGTERRKPIEPTKGGTNGTQTTEAKGVLKPKPAENAPETKPAAGASGEQLAIPGQEHAAAEAASGERIKAALDRWYVPEDDVNTADLAEQSAKVVNRIVAGKKLSAAEIRRQILTSLPDLVGDVADFDVPGSPGKSLVAEIKRRLSVQPGETPATLTKEGESNVKTARTGSAVKAAPAPSEPAAGKSTAGDQRASRSEPGEHGTSAGRSGGTNAPASERASDRAPAIAGGAGATSITAIGSTSGDSGAPVVPGETPLVHRAGQDVAAEPAGAGQRRSDGVHLQPGDSSGQEHGEGAKGKRNRRGAGDGAGETGTVSTSGRADVAEVEGETAGGAAGGVSAESAIEPAALLPEQLNHRIAGGDIIAPAGEIAKIKANIAAIKLVKELIAADRNATPDEKRTLAQFTGWGGLKSALDEEQFNRYRYALEHNREPPSDAANWFKKYGKHFKELKGLLSDEDFRRALVSTENAHYTSTTIIRGMWQLAQRLGFTSGKVLETSAGIGHFLGLVPSEIAKGVKFTAIELDSISGEILKKLYPQANVQITGFQRAKVEPNSFDMVIGNFPFSDLGIGDANYPRFNLHNYFFAKSIDQVKPGGLIVAVTSESSMDRGGSLKWRQWMAQRGDLVGAIRLPKSAFAGNAGTEVVTDILIFRKKDGQGFTLAQPFQTTVQVDVGGKPYTINEYYHAHPENVLGKLSFSGTMYVKDAQSVEPTGDLNQQLKEAIERMPAGVAHFDAIQEAEAARTGGFAEAEQKEYSYQEKDGQIFQVINRELVRPEWFKSLPLQAGRVKRALAWLGVREVAKKAVNIQLDKAATEEAVTAARDELNKVYDAFVKKHGPVNRLANRFLSDDPEYPLTSALETKKHEIVTSADGKETVDPVYLKSPIFDRRTMFPVEPPIKADSLPDALNISLSWRGRLDVPWMAELLNKTPDQVRDDLLAREQAYLNPVTGLLETPDEYLSGNVRQKLKQAQDGGKNFTKNAEALAKVQPARKGIAKIQLRLGSTWIPTHVVGMWLTHIFDHGPIPVTYVPQNGKWIVAWPMMVKNSAIARDVYAAGGVNAADLIEDALNLQNTVVEVEVRNADGSKSTVKDPAKSQAAQEGQEKLKQMFRKWVKDSTHAKELEDIYNEVFNAHVDRQWRGASFETYPNASDVMTPYEWQKAAISRGMSQSYINGHAVGTGKTLTLVTSAIEWRRLGLARKPMLVAQNSTVGDIVETFKKLYPWANVLAPSAADFSSQNRKRLLSRIATGDYDAIVMAHSQFDLIPDSNERLSGYLNQEIEELQEAIAQAEREEGKRGTTVRELGRMLRAREERLQALAGRKVDQTLTFEQLGIDGLLVDEAHAYKKLEFFTRVQNVKGLDKGASLTAFSMMMKVRHIQERTGGRNIVFATGTPITNTLAEVWNMVRFVRPDLLAEFGVPKFDDFFAAFTEAVTNTEYTDVGEWRPVTRLSKFNNVQQLIRMWKQAADVINPENVNLQRPGLKNGKPTIVKIDRTERVSSYMEYLLDRYKRWMALSGKEKREQSAEPLVINGLAKKAALDLRLVDPTLSDEPGSKLSRAAQDIYDIWKATAEKQSTQLVFADLYQSSAIGPGGLPVSDSSRFNVYNALKQKLIDLGIPANEVANINDYDGTVKRTILYEKVNNGTIRVLMGSTEKMGVGVNVQRKLIALHHLDAPWRPSDMEQREGRIVRQQNENTEVDVRRYGVEKTLDAGMFSRLSLKQQFINQVIRGDISDDAIEDINSEVVASFNEAFAEFTGDPLAREKVETESNVRRLESLESAWHQGLIDAKYKLAMHKKDIPIIEHQAKMFLELHKKYAPLFEKDTVPKIVLDGKELTVEELQAKIKERADMLAAWAAEHFSVTPHSAKMGNLQINGLIVHATMRLYTNQTGRPTGEPFLEYHAEAPELTDKPLGGSQDIHTATGLVQSIKGRVAEMPATAGYSDKTVERLKRDLTQLEGFVKQPFEGAADLEKFRGRFAEIMQELAKRAEAAQAKPPTTDELAEQPPEQTAIDQLKKGVTDFLADEAGGAKLPDWLKNWIDKRLAGRKPTPNDAYAFDTAEIEKRYLEARKGIQKPPILDRLREFASDLWANITRPFAALPLGAQYAEAKAALLLLKKQKGMQAGKAIKALDQIVSSLSPAEFDIFSRKVLLDDLVEEAERQQEKIIEDGGTGKVKLPFGFDEDVVRSESERVNAEVGKSAAIIAALMQRTVWWKAAKREYVREMKRLGFDAAKKLTRQAYFRHQVLMYAEAAGIAGGKDKLGVPASRSFLKQRHGSELDINANYLQAEYQVLAQMMYDTEIARTLNRVGKFYDMMPALKKEAIAVNDAAVLEMFQHMIDAGLADPSKTPEELYRETLNWKQAMGFEKVYRLAGDDELPDAPDSRWRDLLDHLADVNARRTLARRSKGTLPTIDNSYIGEFWKYAAWLMKGSDPASEAGRMAIGAIFKGRAEKKKAIEKMLGERVATWQTLIPEGYVEWQPRSGSHFYLADSIPARVAEQLLGGQLQEYGLKAAEIRKVLAKGAPFKPFVIPAELAKTLDDFFEGPATDRLARFTREAQDLWKQWVLFNPRRAIKYNLRNASGDLDAVIAFNPGTLNYVLQAAKELKDGWGTKGVETPMLKAFRERGGAQLTLQVQELGDVTELELFRKFDEKTGVNAIMRRAWEKWWIKSAAVANYREAVLRYAAFLSYADQLDAGKGTPKNYGASLPDEINGLSDRTDRAFLLSNEVLGAYDSVGVVGQTLRRYWYPFWSFTESNMRRYIRGFKNAARDEQTAAFVGRLVYKKAANPLTYVRIGAFVLRAMAMWAALTMLNLLLHHDAEMELPPEIRARPHITLGRDPLTGKIIYFDRLGALGDVLEWFGLDTPEKDARDWLSGRRSLVEVIEDMAISPVNKINNGLNPFFKAFAEFQSGRETYPDIRKPKLIRDYGDWLARKLSLENEYRSITGQPTPGYFKSLLQLPVYETDPDGNAYYRILDEKSRYMKNVLGRSDSVSEGGRSNALRTYKMAVRYHDDAAAQKALDEYFNLGGTDAGLDQSFKNLDPLAGLSKPDQDDFVLSLNGEDKAQLEKAYRYYETVLQGSPAE